jgi:TolA-binding protein
MREGLATALMKKAMVLADLDRDAEAIAAYTDLIQRFSDDETPTLQGFVAAAREARAQLLKE